MVVSVVFEVINVCVNVELIVLLIIIWVFMCWLFGWICKSFLILLLIIIELFNE